jgi:UDP-glucose 4-epimerase
MKKILVLGGNGFIGKNLVRHLLHEAKNEIWVVARKPSLDDEILNVKYIYSDFSDLSDYTDLCRKMDCIYHLVSQSYPFTTWDNPMMEIDLNLIPTLKFLESIGGYVPLIVFVSSGGTIYGNHMQISSEKSIPRPNNPHGIIKLCIENFLLYYQVKHNLNFLIFRVSNVYGPGQRINKGLGFINTTIEKILRQQDVVLYGDGNQHRDFIFIDDVAKVLAMAINSHELNKTYNLSSGFSNSLNEIIDIVKNELKRPISLQKMAARQFDLKKINIDNSCLLKDFENLEFTSLKTGIVQTIKHLQSIIVD